MVYNSNDPIEAPLHLPSSRGFTLTEIAIVLGIIGLLLGAIWEGASTVYFNLKMNKAIQQLAMTASGIRSLYGTQNISGTTNFEDMTSAMVLAKVFPSDVPIVNGLPQDVWGGEIKVEAQGNCGGPYSNGGSCDEHSFEIEYINSSSTPLLPCSAMLGRLIGSGRDPTLVAVYVSGTGWLDPGTLRVAQVPSTCSYVSFAYTLKVN